MYEGDGHVSQSRDGIVPVPWVPDLVRGRTPVEVEEEIRLGGDLPTRYQGGTVGREGRDGGHNPCSSSYFIDSVMKELSKSFAVIRSVQIRGMSWVVGYRDNRFIVSLSIVVISV